MQARIEDRVGTALEYACRSWHSHLTRTMGDITSVIPNLRYFLEKKFLAWLEMVSVLRAVKQTRDQRQTGCNDLPGRGERVANGW